MPSSCLPGNVVIGQKKGIIDFRDCESHDKAQARCVALRVFVDYPVESVDLIRKRYYHV
jgi:hypothetical protein